MRSTMRLTWALICTAIVGAAGTPAAAQTFPTRAVRIVVPFPPGGPADVLGRMLGQKLAEFAAILKSDFDKWAKVVKAAGLRAD